MVILSVMGHVFVSRADQPLELPVKSRALLTYLALERKPQSRERLASLLWENAEAKHNLRVELNRMRTAGLNLFPANTQMLHLEALQTDWDCWLSRAHTKILHSEQGDFTQIIDWSSEVRGIPLSGLEDLGSAEFRDWVYAQRQHISEQIEQCFEQVAQRWKEHLSPSAWGSLRSRAELLGLEFQVPSPASSRLMLEPPHTPSSALGPATDPTGPAFRLERRVEMRSLEEIAARVGMQSQAVGLLGEAGSGKSDLVQQFSLEHRVPLLKVTSSRSPRLVLASLAMQMLPLASGQDQQVLNEMLVHPHSLEGDLAKLASVLGRLGPCVGVTMDHLHNAPVELATLLEFLIFNTHNLLLLLLSRENAEHPGFVVRLGQRLPDHLSLLPLHTVSCQSVMDALERRFPGTPFEDTLCYASQLLQRSEGNTQHLVALLERDRQTLRDRGLPPSVRERYMGEMRGWPADLQRAAQQLSLLYSLFDEDTAEQVLRHAGLEHPQTVLAQALERGVLREVALDRILNFGAGPTQPPHPLNRGDFTAPTAFEFREEGLRVALASSVPQHLRRELRQYLAALMAHSQPGLASLYAQRAGMPAEAARLRLEHFARLPSHSPLHTGTPPPTRSSAAPMLTLEPRPTPSPGWSLCERGYHLQLEGGWLHLRRRGRYGHPETLRLLFELPSQPSPHSELTVVWRLDEYSGGHETLPLEVPFALRVRGLNGRADPSQATVLTPEALDAFEEDGLVYQVRTDVQLCRWMTHTLRFSGPVSRLELSLRTLDVALIVGKLEWEGLDLFRVSLERSRSPSMSE